MICLSHIWRHPVKAHGTEALENIALTAGECLPFDRKWAVAHEISEADGSAWAPCANFSRGAKAPGLMAIEAETDTKNGQVTLRHPDLPVLQFDPETEGDRLVSWSRPLIPESRAASNRVVSVPGRGMTDSDFPSVSILNHASNRALGAQLGLAPGEATDMRRWRGNLWLEGLEAWAEFDLIGKRLRIGEAELLVREKITRCMATMANPTTGKIDLMTLDALKAGWGMREFGVYATVECSGKIAVSDEIEVIG